MLDACFLITTYNREKTCQELVDSLQGLGDIIVVHDGNNYEIKGATNINPRAHMGKMGYWKLVNLLFHNKTTAKYYFMIPDDFLVCDSQIAKAIEIWESIKDPQKICLNLYMDRYGKRCWTDLYPIDRGVVWQIGWVDMCFLCEKPFFNKIGYIPCLHRKAKNRNGSSGVGAYISRKLHKVGCHFYQVKESLITITEEHYKSQMHR